MLLEHVKGITPDAELEAEYAELTEQTNKVLDKINLLLEAPLDGSNMAGMEATPAGGQGSEPMSRERMPMPGQVQGGGSMEEVIAGMEQVMQQMDAAKRGLGLVNKLADGPSRTKNRSRIMGNMNRIRANVRRIEKMLANME